MNDQARVALTRVLSTYGPAICQMPQSAELFVRKECSPYPNESRVLVEALRHGVTTELALYNPADRPWDVFSTDLTQRLQKRAGLNDVEGTWAVDAWARALGRHPESIAEAPLVTAAPAEPTMSMGTIKLIMLAIASGGGAAGGALGAVILPAALLLTTTTREISMFQSVVGGVSKQDIWKMITIALLVISAIGAVGGGIGAAIGWWHGRGDRNPWSAALAAFGGAFITAAVSGRIFGSVFLGIFGWFFGALFGAFGGARTAASRGGYG